MRHLQVKEHQRLPANYQKLGRSKEGFSYRSGGSTTLLTLCFQAFGLQNLRQHIFVVLGHLVYGTDTLLQQP